MKATLKDIAKDTGLSLATISKYINNKPVSPRNREKIEESIAKFGYTVNTAARSLRTRRTRTIGIISPAIGHPYWGSVISYVEQFLWEHEYSTIICTHNVNSINEQQSVQFLIDKRVDGILYIAYSQDDSSIKLIQEQNIPIVFLDNKPDTVTADFVTSQNKNGVFGAVEYLIQHNHQRIALITTNSLYTTAERLFCYKQALKHYSIPVKDNYIIYNTPNSNLENTQLPGLLASSLPPTAIIASTYDTGVDIITYAHRHGLTIPDDISLIIFDDNNIFKALNITVVRQDFFHLVQNSVRLLIERINENTELPVQHIQVDTDLVVRGSVKFVK